MASCPSASLSTHCILSLLDSCFEPSSRLHSTCSSLPCACPRNRRKQTFDPRSVWSRLRYRVRTSFAHADLALLSHVLWLSSRVSMLHEDAASRLQLIVLGNAHCRISTSKDANRKPYQLRAENTAGKRMALVGLFSVGYPDYGIVGNSDVPSRSTDRLCHGVLDFAQEPVFESNRSSYSTLFQDKVFLSPLFMRRRVAG